MPKSPPYVLRKLKKTPSDGTLLERTSGRCFLCWLLLLFYLHWKFLLFWATFPPWLLRPVKVSTSFEIYPDYFRLLYFCQIFSSQFYRQRYGFQWAFFIRRRFYFTLLHQHFWHAFVTQMRAGSPYPGSFSVPALTELSLPADAWT